MSHESPDVELLESLLAAFNRHDVEDVMEFFTEGLHLRDATRPGSLGPQARGQAEVREGFEARFAGIPDIHYGKDRHWACGDRGVSEWTITGTDTSGKRVEVQGCDLFEFREGKIARKDSYWKTVA